MKTPTKITFIPVANHKTIHGKARAIEKPAKRQWRKQISDWFATVPGTESARVEFCDDTWETIHNPAHPTKAEKLKTALIEKAGLNAEWAKDHLIIES